MERMVGIETVQPAWTVARRQRPAEDAAPGIGNDIIESTLRLVRDITMNYTDMNDLY